MDDEPRPSTEHPTAEGTPQGSPLSPLLANIMLDDLDHELELRGHPFVRYADDLRINVASERAAARVLDGVTTFVERRLKLRVNREKSGVAARPDEASRLRLLQARRQREGQARPQGEASPEGSTTPPRLPSTEHRDVGPAARLDLVPRSLGCLLRAGREHPRCSTSSMSGSAAGCGRCAGRNEAALLRGVAISSHWHPAWQPRQ